MKKYQLNFLVFVFVFSLFFSVNNKASAISGACSYHGGVNCSVGADYDGSVICNDGWRDSSVGYYETSSCSSSNIPLCVSLSVYGCNTESDYSSRRALWARSGYSDTMLSNLQECRNQIDEYNRLKVEYDQCFYNLTHPTPYPIPVATSRPIPTPSYDPCPEGWINLRSLNLCINPQQSPTPTPTPFINDRNYQNEQFDTDFSKTVYPLVLEDFPNVTPSKFKEIRDKVYQIAFTKDFVKVPLGDIYKTIVKPMFLEPTKSPVVSSTAEPLFQNLFTAPPKTPIPQIKNEKINHSSSGQPDIVRFTPEPSSGIQPTSTQDKLIETKNQNAFVKILKLIKKIKFW